MKYLFQAFLIFSFLVSGIISKASHIVGGEFEVFLNPRGSSYTINMNQYFDELSAGVGLLESDQKISIGVYEKGTNVLATTVTLSLISWNFISNASGGCVNPSLLKFRNKFYSGILYSTELNSSNGYYISWEQCCRNNSIVNVVSSGNEPITFYAELPPFNIFNSSPDFPQMENRNLCRNQLNTFDFSGVDLNGDSLIYEMISPVSRSVNSTGSYPDGGQYYSGPYFAVNWASGYSANAQITGSQNLTIDRFSGVMSVNPSSLGLYVFGVLVSEYRNGVKIGAVKREFQMNVIDCPVNNPPKISFNNTTILEGDTIEIRLKATPPQCYSLDITDGDVTGSTPRSEFINIKVLSNQNIQNLITIPSSTVVTPTDPISTVDMCFNPCKLFADGMERYLPIKLVVNDNSCPAKYDTLIFILHVIPSANHKPVIDILPAGNPKSILVDSTLNFLVRATDVDSSDPLSLYINGATNRSFYFENVQDSFVTISSPFIYTPTCDDWINGSFTVFFIVDDGNCDINRADTIYQTITIENNPDVLKNLSLTNLVTPNGDGNNDTFYIPNMPPDNCISFFKSFTIYNRWGALIYKTSKRDFVWDPKDLSEGIYYYQLDLNSSIQKGWIQVMGY
jgi:gliding motility-associated-like protein